MSSSEIFFTGMATTALLGLLAYLAFVIVRERRTKAKIRLEVANPAYREKLAAAQRLVEAIATVAYPPDVRELVMEAMREIEFTAAEIQRGQDLQHRDVFGFPANVMSGHLEMARFAKKHLSYMPVIRNHDVYYIADRSWWASQREAQLIAIRAHYSAVVVGFAAKLRNDETGRYGSKQAQEASALVTARLRGAATSVAEIQKTSRQEKARVLVDTALTEEERNSICEDLDSLAKNEIDRLKRKLGIA